MQTQTTSADKTRRAAHAAQYAPRKRQVPAVKLKPLPGTVELRKLTAKVLDELKKPGVVPSAVILAALIEAQSHNTR